jgi:hypothetical protein
LAPTGTTLSRAMSGKVTRNGNGDVVVINRVNLSWSNAM